MCAFNLLSHPSPTPRAPGSQRARHHSPRSRLPRSCTAVRPRHCGAGGAVTCVPAAPSIAILLPAPWPPSTAPRYDGTAAQKPWSRSPRSRRSAPPPPQTWVVIHARGGSSLASMLTRQHFILHTRHVFRRVIKRHPLTFCKQPSHKRDSPKGNAQAREVVAALQTHAPQ